VSNVVTSIKATNTTAFIAGASLSVVSNIFFATSFGHLLSMVWFFISVIIFVKGFNTLDDTFLKVVLRFFIWFVGASSVSILLYNG
jgi:hypothetical protein